MKKKTSGNNPKSARPMRKPAGAKSTPAPTRPASADEIFNRFCFHLKYSRCKDFRTATLYDKLISLSRAVRDLAVDKMVATQQAYVDHDVKRVYYLSLEFLLGRLLRNNLIALGVVNQTRAALKKLGLTLEELAELEEDAGLGNGGLGRLAACYLDSMATQQLPGYGYGLRYEHGMFRQEFFDGWQYERPDDWLKYGNTWEMVRPEYAVPVLVYGKVEYFPDKHGQTRPVWTNWQMFEGIPYDMPVIGFGCNTVNILRLWSSRAAEGFRLDVFNRGEYIAAVAEKNWAETVTKVLYPSENTSAGRELRLIQEYFLVACTIRDIIRRYKKNHAHLANFDAKNAVQLNDTHPALAVAELMRYLVDEESMPWDQSWEITTRTLAYTNHTLLPEALEKWPVPLLEKVLPRHLQIIYEINRRFLDEVAVMDGRDGQHVKNLSLIEEGEVKQVRMANLAMVGSHAVNGVARLHTELLQSRVVPDFYWMWPDKFLNITNGVTQRRWLLACNPGLAGLITEAIGPRWVTQLDELQKLEALAKNKAFLQKLQTIKRANKVALCQVIKEQTGIQADPDSLFDVQVKRLHEYKRQLLNVMHIMALYYQLKDNPRVDVPPRTFIFGAKAAPGYHMAKLIIKLINSVADAINNDASLGGRLKVVFLPDYRVSLAEQIMPAADLSEQISTAGMEASGTGNMKLSLNGALTIGTWDGANIEIAEAVGLPNIFIFGKRAEELAHIRDCGYTPWDYYHADAELRRVVDAIRNHSFAPGDTNTFRDIGQTLLEWGDYFFHLLDYRSYVETQAQVGELYRTPQEWNRKVLINIARMGYFSSDRAVREYAENIWDLRPLPIRLKPGKPWGQDALM